MDPAELRVSDADRERAVELLRGHAAVGRLTIEELDERIAHALSARTAGELTVLLHDLPREPAPARPPAPVRAPPRVPGRYHFAETWRAPTSLQSAMAELMEHVAPPLTRYGYKLVDRSPYRLVFAKSRRPVWTFVVAIALFPFGLLALLYQDEQQIVIDLQPSGKDTLVSATGVAPLEVRRAFALLEA